MSTAKPKNLPASGKALVLSLATSLTHSRTQIDLPANIAAQRSKTANGDPPDTAIFSVITFGVSNAVRNY